MAAFSVLVFSGCQGAEDEAGDEDGGTATPMGGARGGPPSGNGGATSGGSGSPGPNGDTNGGTRPNAAPRPAGTPLPPDQLGAILEGEQGSPKYADTHFDADKKIALWVPPGEGKIRGVHLNLLVSAVHGGGMVNNLLDRQLASSWNFATVAGWYVWQTDRDSAAEGWAAVQALLEKVAGDTKHPELATAPVFVSGGSRTGRWGTSIVQLIPDRMIGYFTLIANAAGERERTPVLLATPGLLVPGERDGGAQIISGMEKLRTLGARVAGAMMWGKGHICGPCENVMYPFIDAVIRHRLDNSGKVVDARDDEAWLGDHQNWSAYPAADFPGDANVASWLIDAHFANVWRAFMLKETKGSFTQPPLLTKSPQVSTVRAVDLTSVTAKLTGITGKVQLVDGAAPLGEAVPDGQGVVVFSGLTLKPGIHSFIVMQEGTPLTSPVLAQLL